MSIHTLHFTSNATAALIQKELVEAFPGTTFEIRIDVPSPPYELSQNLTAIIVRWSDGPSRDPRVRRLEGPRPQREAPGL